MSKRARPTSLVSTRSSKRKKIVRTPTVELEEEEVQENLLDRKTTSFLEQIEDENVSVLSSKSRSKLLSRLSSIFNPESIEPEPIDLCRMEGMEAFPVIESPQIMPTLDGLPISVLVQIFSFLSDLQRWKLARVCKKMHYVLRNFVGFELVPCSFAHRNTTEWVISKPKEEMFCLGGFNFSSFVEARKFAVHVLKTKNVPQNFARMVNSFLGQPDKSFYKSWGLPWHGDLAPSGVVCQPKGLSLRLYDYQAKGLTWMLGIERIARTQQKIELSTLMHIPCTANIAYQTAERQSGENSLVIAKPELYREDRYRNSFTTQGGMFSDEMGLGKTISMISLILSNPRPEKEGELIPCRLDEDDIKPFFETKATLVVCPSQLVNQWKNEVTSHTSLTCLTAATAAQHRKLSYRKLVETDVIIVSYRVFITPEYLELWGERSGTKVGFNREEANISGRQPVFHMMGWHRVILDEGHELLAAKNQYFPQLISNYKWYVTGTAIPRGKHSLSAALEFLSCYPKKQCHTNNMEINIQTKLFHRAVKRSLYWRNTKQSVENQVEIPPVAEEVQLVTLSPIEKTIYNAMCFDKNSSRARREFLGEPTKFVRFSSLDDPVLPQFYIADYKTKIQDQAKHIKQQERILADAQERLEQPDITANRRDADMATIKRTQKTISYHEDTIVRYICQSACFSHLLVGDTSMDVCDGCDQYASGPVKIPCGHLLCPVCVQQCRDDKEGKSECKKCHASFNFAKVKLSKDEKLPVMDNAFTDHSDPWFNDLRAKFGSKFANIAQYLSGIMKDDAEVKLIVFSQYDSALNKLSSTLEDLDAETFENRIVSCKGNVHARKKQLERFLATGEDAARILLLSLKNSASGTHLAAATHVLLLDPVVGSEGEARATDAQAIARAHRLGQDEPVTAIRFIVIETIDQDDYEKAYGSIIVPRKYGPKSARK